MNKETLSLTEKDWIKVIEELKKELKQVKNDKKRERQRIGHVVDKAGVKRTTTKDKTNKVNI